MIRRIGVVTVGRSDYTILRPVVRRIQDDPALELSLFVAGAHLLEEYGKTEDEIEFPVTELVDMLMASDAPSAIAKSLGLGVMAFAQAFVNTRPDILLLTGYRFEQLAAGLAALPQLIPVAHLHGGEVTEGAIDDSMRHCLTKLAHLHFATTDGHAARILQLGEEPWRIIVSGAPSLDNLPSIKWWTARDLGINEEQRPVLVTYHPVTTELDSTAEQMEELLAALEIVNRERPVLFTAPNNDPMGRVVRRYIDACGFGTLHLNCDTEMYFSLMNECSCMVGNSSSGLIEAPSLWCPVVNIGPRQKGRTRGSNVIDCPCERGAIVDVIGLATSEAFRAAMRDCHSPYQADRPASDTIVEVLAQVDLDRLIPKRFWDARKDQI